MVASVGDELLSTASLIALIGAAILSLALLSRLDGADLRRRARRRLLLGVPWGTLAAIGLVLLVYLFVQGGWRSSSTPLVLPFHSWSYTNVVGLVTSSFAHADLGHLTGNVLGTLVFATAAEYAWSHYPTGRGTQSFSPLGANPYARALAFVGAVVAVGLAAGVLVPGPNIGFSVLVYAFAGFAIVAAPVAALAAILASSVVNPLYYAVIQPVATSRAELQYAEPWFAGISLQGHTFGLVVGILLGVALVYRRRSLPPVRYVWFATLVFAITRGLYALYWYDGATAFRLYRAAGLALVFVLVAVVVGTLAVSEESPIPRSDLAWGHLAVIVLAAVVLAMGLAAVPHNLADVQSPDGDVGVEVRDYTVYYAEDVPHGYAQAVSLPFGLGNVSDSARASGVIVVNDRLDVWREAVPAGRLALRGQVSVPVGGIGWRDRVVANRTGWNAVDAGETYKVYLHRDGGPRELAYAAEPVSLAPRVAGYNLSLGPTAAGYALNATRNGSVVDEVAVPGVNASAALGDVTVARRGDDLYVREGETQIRVAQYRRSGRDER